MTNLLAVPLIVSLATACVCLLAWSRPRVQRMASFVGAGLSVFVGIALLAVVTRQGTQYLAVGGWSPHIGIVLVGDTLGAVLVAMTSIVGLAVITDSLLSIGPDHEAYGYHPLVHLLLLGVYGAFLTGDLFNLYVWFEVLLIASFVLLSLGAERPQLEASIKYVALNLIASGVFLCALGLMYGTFGTLNLASLSIHLAQGEGRGFATPLSMMFLVAFGVKAGLVPLHAWLPASYHTPPASVGALFAGLLTKVGVVALLKVFLLAFRFDPALTDTTLAWMAAITMLFGGLGAMVQTDLRRMLAFTVLSGVGAMVLGISLRSEAGTAATVTYLLHSAIAAVAAFLIAGAIHRRMGTSDLREMAGLATAAPRLHMVWLIVVLALAGIPPLSGFFGKLALVKAGLESGKPWLVAALLLSSLFILAGFLRAWSMMQGEREEVRGRIPVPAAVMAAATIGFAVFAGPIAKISARVGQEMAQPDMHAIRILRLTAARSGGR